jgi:hypothetical protein
MNVQMQASYQVTPEQIAQALAGAEPWEFAVVWRELHKILDREGDADKRLREFAEHMAPDHGSNCQKPLRRLVQLIDFYIEQERSK